MNIKDKIGFILSCRLVREPELGNTEFYQYIFNEYLTADVQDVEIEYEFYLNN